MFNLLTKLSYYVNRIADFLPFLKIIVSIVQKKQSNLVVKVSESEDSSLEFRRIKEVKYECEVPCDLKKYIARFFFYSKTGGTTGFPESVMLNA